MQDITILKNDFPEVYAFIQNQNLDLLDEGRYELNHGIYVNIESYQTSYEENRKFEVHRRYIDIQYIIEGKEKIYFTRANRLRKNTEYEEIRDIEFLEATNIENYRYEILEVRNFLIIEPLIAHMPCICINEPEKVKKAVFKCPADLL